MNIERFISKSYPLVESYSATSLVESVVLERGFVVVVNEDHSFCGILTTQDLVKRPHNLVIDCLTKKEPLDADENVLTALDKFDAYHCVALPVFKGNEFVGVVEKAEIVHYLKSEIRSLCDQSIISQKVKESFLNVLSHEIRTPLNGLLGFLELISDLRMEGGGHSEQKMQCEIIKKSADRLLLILNDLFDLALMSTGNELELEVEKVNVENLFLDLKSYFELVVSASNRNLSVSYVNPNSALVLSTDGKKLKHILYHLIDNAIKFSPDNEEVCYGYKKKDDGILFFVKNHGPRISDEMRSKIFQPFEKQEYCNNGLVEGLGIGLPLVKKLCNLLNGSIDLVSTDTQTTFYFKLYFEPKTCLSQSLSESIHV